jgi:hypothetical protein
MADTADGSDEPVTPAKPPTAKKPGAAPELAPPPPPPPPTPALPVNGEASPVASAAKPGRRKIIVIGIAAALAVVLIVTGGIFVVTQFLGGGSSPASAGQNSQSDDEDDEDEDDPGADVTPSADPDTTPEPDPAPTEDAAPALEFKSNSGNIRCRITEESAICRQGEIQYAVPSKNCSPLSGATIGVDRRHAFWPCIDAEIQPTEILPYDTEASRYGFTCSINYTIGVTCYNDSGAGFTMEYSAGVSTF